jgi:hypothetical protein
MSAKSYNTFVISANTLIKKIKITKLNAVFLVMLFFILRGFHQQRRKATGRPARPPAL